MQLRLILILAVLTPIGLATKYYTGPTQTWVHNHLGGVLYVTFWCLFILALRPKTSPRHAAATVLCLTSLLECLQLWHPPFLETIRSTFLGHTLIGNTFSWLDFPHYLLGALLALTIARFNPYPS